jgi:hypothetical protein
MVAAEVDPGRLVFVDEMGVHTSLAPLYGYSRKGEPVRLKVPRNLKSMFQNCFARSCHRNGEPRLSCWNARLPRRYP